METSRQRDTDLAIHLVEAIENVERLLRFVVKVSNSDTKFAQEARSILRDFGRVVE